MAVAVHSHRPSLYHIPPRLSRGYSQYSRHQICRLFQLRSPLGGTGIRLTIMSPKIDWPRILLRAYCYLVLEALSTGNTALPIKLASRFGLELKDGS